MNPVNSSTSSTAAKTTAASASAQTPVPKPNANSASAANVSNTTTNPSPNPASNYQPRQVDMPIQGERQCYFGEVVNERGTYWAQLLVRVVDKVSVMVDTPDRVLVATHLLGGNAKLFLNRQIVHTEVVRSPSGEDQILLHTHGGTGYADKLVFQYNRV